jgi:hypothetical protein
MGGAGNDVSNVVEKIIEANRQVGGKPDAIDLRMLPDPLAEDEGRPTRKNPLGTYIVQVDGPEGRRYVPLSTASLAASHNRNGELTKPIYNT